MENYFRDALHNFIFEEAGGGAIRHLADRGYTARQIADALSFPMPYETVRETYTKYLLENQILLKERPEKCRKQEKVEYIREYDKYGKPSFRKVVVLEASGPGEEQRTGQRQGQKEKQSEGQKQDVLVDRLSGTPKWEELEFEEFLLLYRSGKKNISLSAETRLAEAEKNIYISCGFGADKTGDMLQVLEKAQREYIQGICWTRKTMYHLLDKRMLGIAIRLHEVQLPERESDAVKVYIRH